MRPVLLLPLCAAVLLAACAGQQPQGSAAPGTTTPSGPQPDPTAGNVPPTTPDGDLVVPSRKPPGLLRVRGTVTAGEEPGCLLLTGGGAVYELLGPARAGLRTGDVVVVEGRTEPAAASTCQQGTPLTVLSVTPAD